MARRSVLPRQRDWLPWTGGALAALLAAAPAVGATHTITSGTVVYPGTPYGANDAFIVSGASTVLEIRSGSLPLTNTVDLQNGATVDNAGSITRTGSGNRGVVGGNGHVINRATGVITANGATGVLLYEGGSVLNDGGLISGTVYGISLQGDTGEVTNRNGGSIVGDVMLWDGGSVTNTGAGSQITGGISVLGDGGTVTNSDGAKVIGTGRVVHIRGGGTLINSGEGSTLDGRTAVHIEGGGVVENGAGAIIRGVSDGIYGDASTRVTNNGTIEVTDGDGVNVAGGTVTNAGADASITASGTGVALGEAGEVTNRDGATISSGGDGIALALGGTVTNSGAGTSIEADGTGIYLGDVGEVTNSDGASIVAGADGIVLDWGGDVTNSGGATIHSSRVGVVIWDYGTLRNSGAGSTIRTVGGGVGVDLMIPVDTDSLAVINEDGAVIDGGYAGLRFSATGKVTNSGTDSLIAADSYAIFYEYDAGDVTNQDGARIVSRDGSGVAFYFGGDVSNSSGAQIDAEVVGIYSLGAPASVTNTGTDSLIRGKAQGIYLNGENGGAGIVVNSDGATIAGGGDADGGMGVWIVGDGTVTNDGATITGDRATGVFIRDDGTITNTNGGSIEGSQAAHIGGDGNVANTTGSRMGDLHVGGDAEISNDASTLGSVTVDGSAVIRNSAGATIAGITAGTAQISNDAATINAPATDYGIVLAEGGSITNSNGGRIEGGPIAIYLYENGGTVINGAGSTIASTSTGIHAFGDTDVVNAGTIEGNVWLEEEASNSVTLLTGSRITGDLHIGSNSTSRLILDGAGTQLYSDAVTNDTVFASTVVKQGSGTWTIDKHIDATVFNIDAGTLVLGSATQAGSVAATVYANPGTVVKGSGVIYGNLITDGATIAPGNSPGTLTIVGGYLQDGSSTYALEFDRDANVTDRILVEESAPLAGDGNVILRPGARLDVAQLGTAAGRVGTRYAVLSAANSLSGTFTLTGDLAVSAFLGLEDEYDARNAYLTVVQTRRLAEAAATPNQTAIAEALESTPPGNAARTALLSLPDDDSAARALGQLTGDLHADVRAGLVDATRPLREAALDRLREALCARTSSCEPGATLWTTGYGLVDGSLDLRTGGFLFGADLPGPGTTVLGVYGGAGSSRIGTATSSDVTLGGYGGAALGGLALRGGAAATLHSVGTERRVAFPGYADTLTAGYAALTTQGFMEAGYRIEAGPLDLEPFASLAYVGLATPDFSETGGDAALSGDARQSGVVVATLGLAADAELGPGRMRASAGWQQRLAGDASLAMLGFAGGERRMFRGRSGPAGGLALGLDLDLALGETATLALDYDGVLAAGATQHSTKATLRVAF